MDVKIFGLFLFFVVGIMKVEVINCKRKMFFDINIMVSKLDCVDR